MMDPDAAGFDLVGKLSVYLGERETQECHPGCTEASLDFGRMHGLMALEGEDSKQGNKTY